MSESCRVTLSKSLSHSQMSGGGGRPFWMSVSSREAVLDVRESLPVVRLWLGGSVGCQGMVERVSRMSGNGQEALPKVQEWSVDPPGCP